MNNKGSEVAEKWYQGLDDKKASSIKENYGLEWERLSKIAKLLIYNDCKNYFEDDEDYLTEAEKRSIYGDYQYQCFKEE